MMSQAPPETAPGRLVLLVNAETPSTTRAQENLSRALKEMGTRGLPSDWFDIIDLAQQPDRGLEHGIFATPALLLTGRPGQRTAILYGDLSNEDRLRHFLINLAPRTSPDT